MSGDKAENRAAHALERTSPKGELFVGTCWKCGRAGLSSPFDAPECDNLLGTTADEDPLIAIEGPKSKPKLPFPNLAAVRAKANEILDAAETAQIPSAAADQIVLEELAIAQRSPTPTAGLEALERARLRILNGEGARE